MVVLRKQSQSYRVQYILKQFRRNCHLSDACTFTPEREKVARQIIEAFLNTTLGDGIGFYEADCIDDYLPPEDEEYQYWKGVDERVYWEKVYALAHSENFPRRFHPFSAISFMDAVGKKFAMPCYLLWALEHGNHIDLAYITQNDFYMKDLSLSLTQRQAVIATLQFLCDEAFAGDCDVQYDELNQSILYLRDLWSDV